MTCAHVVQATFPILISSSASNCMNLGGVEGQAPVRKPPGLWSPPRAAGPRG